jgi:hypothetical protein
VRERERADGWETVVEKGERLPEFAHTRGGSRKMGMRMQHPLEGAQWTSRLQFAYAAWDAVFAGDSSA